MNRANSRVRGLLATLALVGFMVGVPVVLVAIDALPDPSAFTWSRLTSQDDGTLALQVITAVCWIAWAVFTCQLIASIVSQVRGIRTPRLPGLAVPQLAADRLVAAAALLFVAVPAVSAVLPQPRAHAAVAAPLPEDAGGSGRRRGAGSAPSRGPRAGGADQRPSATRSSAATASGRSPKNDSVTARGTSSSSPSTRPSSTGVPTSSCPEPCSRSPVADDSSDGSYVVQPGDTLSEISEDQLGDADAYPSIFRASRDTVQPNGAHLSDPDLILPGWKLTIPGQPDPAEPQKPKHAQDPPVHETTPPDGRRHSSRSRSSRSGT